MESSEEKSDFEERFATPVDHPKIRDLELDRIRIFLRRYKYIALKLSSRAQQISESLNLSREALRPVSLKFAVDTEEIEEVLFHRLVNGITSYIKLDDDTLREYLKSKSKKEQKTLTVPEIRGILKKEL